MPNGTGPIPERPAEYTDIKAGVCVTTGELKGCIKVGTVHYWLSRKRDAPFYWENNTDTPGEAMVSMTADVWEKCKDEGTYTYSSEIQGWMDGEETAWRWDGQPGKPIFLSNDFEV